MTAGARLIGAMRALTILLAGLALTAAATPPRLTQFEGDSRVALMFAPASDDARFLAQTDQLAKLTAQPNFQSLIVAGIAGATVIGLSDSASALRARFGVGAGAFRLVLVGKDGQAALSQAQVVTAARLAEAIDAMPMRRKALAAGQTR